VDRFANHVNTQLGRFNSRFWVPDTDAVDAFTCNWAEDNTVTGGSHLSIYTVIPRVIRHAQNCGTKGTLVASQWISSPFWPLIFPNGSNPAEFVVECLTLPNNPDLILTGCVGTSLFKGVLRIHQY